SLSTRVEKIGREGMGSEGIREWGSKPCMMGIDEAGRGPVLGPMVYGCLYCSVSYKDTLSTLSFAASLYKFELLEQVVLNIVSEWFISVLLVFNFFYFFHSSTDSKTLKEEKREELFENLKADESIGWAVDIIDPRELSAKMLKRTKINLNEISHDSASGLVARVLELGVLLTEVYVDTVGDPEKYRIKLSERFPSVKFVVAKKADSLYPVVSGASIVAKVTRDRALRNWVPDETAENMHTKFGSGYPGDPATKAWLDDHKHSVFGFPTLVRFSWGTCTPYFKKLVEVFWEADLDEESSSDKNGNRRQLKLSSVGVTGYKRKSEEIESTGKSRCKFFEARKLDLLTRF
ncbi:hypothetical protein IFM89_028270, partial [Coptis chinensis]